MNKKLIILFVFAILVEAISTHEITKSLNAQCDDSSSETFDLEVTPSGSIDISEFKITLTLKNGQDDKEGLKAMCTLKELGSDMPSDSNGKAFDSKEFISDEDKNSQGLSQEVLDSNKNSQGLSEEVQDSNKNSQDLSQEVQDSNKNSQDLSQEVLDSNKNSQALSQEVLDSNKNSQGLSQEVLDSNNNSHGLSEEVQDSNKNSQGLSEEVLDSNKNSQDLSQEVRDSNKEFQDGSSDSNNEMTDSDTIMADKDSESSVAEKDPKEDADSTMASLSDTTKSDDEDTGNKGGNDPNSGRRLEGNATPVTYTCTLEGSSKEGSYQITVEGSDLTVGEDFTVELSACEAKDVSDKFSSDEESDKILDSNKGLLSDKAGLLSDSNELSSIILDKGKSEVHLSFRQVSGFNPTDFTFSFFGLTTQNIPIDFSFTFMIFLITEQGKGTPVEAKCTIKEAVELGDLLIKQAEFICSFAETTINLISIEIASCDEVAGLPTDETLLNPKLTDDIIANDASKDKSKQEPPSLAQVNMDSFDFSTVDEGTFEFKLTLDKLNEGIAEGETFDFIFNGIQLLFEILKIEGNILTFEVSIYGELQNQPIAFEQTVVNIDGVEAFVLPGFLTTSITTEGILGPEDSGIKESEGLSDNAGTPSSDEEGLSDNKSDNAGSQSSDEEGSSDKESDNAGSSTTDESGSSDKESDNAGSSDKESDKAGSSSTDESESTDKESDNTGSSTTDESGSTDKESDKAGSSSTDEEGSSDKESDKAGSSTTDESGSTDKESDNAGSSTTDESGSTDKESDNAGSSTTDEEGSTDKESDNAGSDKGSEQVGEDSTEPAGTNQGTNGTNPENTNQQEPGTKNPIGPNETITDSPDLEEEKKEAEVKLAIFITFRQINGFVFEPGTISFNFFALITQSLTAPHPIKLLFNLITTEGMNDTATEIECKLEESVEVKEGDTQQASFKCEYTGLDPNIVYSGLRLNSSEEIAGIPSEDEILLNPALADEAITNGELSDAKETKVPISFEFESLETQTCNKDGKFLLKGKFEKDINILNKFSIPLTFPPEAKMTCSLEADGIQCIADEQLEGSVMIEQQIITDGAEELFILKKVDQTGIKCENGLEIQAEEKIKVDISFRQVSNIEQKAGGNGLRFFFAAFVNNNLKQGYEIQIKVIVIINNEEKEKNATCTLEKAVNAVKGTKTQADFYCEVALEKGEEVKPEDLVVSPYNENIGGCEEVTLEELSPYLTDEAIKESSDSPLSQVIDFKDEENKKKVPPTFTIESMNFNKCSKKGKIKIEGKFSQNITEEMIFELPFSFPKTKVKCTVESAEANAVATITCKMQKVKGRLKFTNLLIEPRLIKKKRLEMLYIEQKQLTLEGQNCLDYNEIKKEHARQRKVAPFTFLQLGRPAGYSGLFFLALTRKEFKNPFSSLVLKIEVTLTVEQNRRRNLETLELDEPISVSCSPKSDAQTNNSVALDCSNDDGKELNPVSTELEDDQIAGAPEEIIVDKNPDLDYSKIDTLKDFDNLPSVTITDIKSNNCSTTGQYVIEANYTGELKESGNKHELKIPFATPDSNGLCTMKVDSSSKKLTLNCDNTESFDVSEIIISPQTVYNESDSTPLFKITNDSTAPSQFACAISDDNYVPPKQNTTNDGGDDGGNKASQTARYRKNSSGLGGGAIAGIVIASVVVIGIVGALIALIKTGAFASKSAGTAASVDNSTINRIKIDEQNPNMV